MLVLVFRSRQHLDELGAFADELLDPAAIASGSEITWPRTSGRASSQRSPFSHEAKKLSAGQQLHQDSPLPLAPQTTTASRGCQLPMPSASSSTSISSSVGGSREAISIGSSNIGAIPSASIAHIAYASCPAWKRTRCVPSDDPRTGTGRRSQTPDRDGQGPPARTSRALARRRARAAR